MPDSVLTIEVETPASKNGTTATVASPIDHVVEIQKIILDEDGSLSPKARESVERSARAIAFSGEDGDTETVFNRTFDYLRLDGAYANMKMLDKFFGVSLGRTIETLFGDEPPAMITVHTGINESVQVPWGKMEIPALDRAELRTRTGAGGRFALQIKARRKHQDKVEEFFEGIEEYLKENSLYHGTATIGIEDPTFLDTKKVDLDEVVYSQEVQELLDGTLWGAIRHTEQMRELGLPLKRAVLLHGPYGTGKSLTGARTSKIAVENGWTFVSARAGYDGLEEALNMAALYTPAVVFYEDVDTEAQPSEDGDEVTRLLDVFDGVTAKDKEIIVVMTTNHLDRIHKGMLRPGRLDSLIELAALDRTGIEKIINKSVAQERLGELDFHAISEEMTDFTPAFVRETVTRAASVALARNNGSTDFQLSTLDLITAAKSLAPQLASMGLAKEDAPRPTLAEAMKGTIRGAVDGIRITDYDGDKIPEYGMKISLTGGGEN